MPQLKVTGTKSLDKVYYRHSGYPGGITATNFRDMQAKHPGRALEKAVRACCPRGPGLRHDQNSRCMAVPSIPHRPAAQVLEI